MRASEARPPSEGREWGLGWFLALLVPIMSHPGIVRSSDTTLTRTIRAPCNRFVGVKKALRTVIATLLEFILISMLNLDAIGPNFRSFLLDFNTKCHKPFRVNNSESKLTSNKRAVTVSLFRRYLLISISIFFQYLEFEQHSLSIWP